MKLKGKIALVAGATRGAGRGIACMLGEAGATVYCTGRSSKKKLHKSKLQKGSAFDLETRPETIEETAELVTQYGGVGIPVRVDHTEEDQVKDLCIQIQSEHGRLDILVNDIWGGDALTEWGHPFWELSLEKGFLMLERAVHTHIITSRHGIPLMLPQRKGLVIEITDGIGQNYRGNLFYDLVKTSIIRLAYAMSEELRPYNIASLALTPGFLRSEAMLEHFGVKEENWQEGARKDPFFIASETPFYVGRAAASLSADPNIMMKSGKVYSSWNLAKEYGFTDKDGSQPDWGQYFAKI